MQIFLFTLTSPLRCPFCHCDPTSLPTCRQALLSPLFLPTSSVVTLQKVLTVGMVVQGGWWWFVCVHVRTFSCVLCFFADALANIQSHWLHVVSVRIPQHRGVWKASQSFPSTLLGKCVAALHVAAAPVACQSYAEIVDAVTGSALKVREFFFGFPCPNRLTNAQFHSERHRYLCLLFFVFL